MIQEKYKFNEADATAISDFILGALVYDPKQRKTAGELLLHPWLADA